MKFTLRQPRDHAGARALVIKGAYLEVGYIWWSEVRQEWVGHSGLTRNVYAPTQAECRRLLEDAVTRALRRLVKEPSE